MYNKIHILGERNCGTNYLLQLIKKNSNIPVYDTLLVHKHFIFDKNIIEKHPETLFIVITKNLNNFIKSFYNAPHHMIGVPLNSRGVSSFKDTNISRLDFLKKEIISDISFTNNRKDIKYKYNNKQEKNSNIVELYYDKLFFYLSLRVNKFQNVEYIKYEDLENDLNVLLKILRKNKIQCKNILENINFYKSDKDKKYIKNSYPEFNQDEKNIIIKYKEDYFNNKLLFDNKHKIKWQYDKEEYYLNNYKNQKPIVKENIKPIEKIIHFIWIGSKIPQKYIDNVQQCQKINNKYQIFLWVDKDTKIDNIIVKNIKEINLISKNAINFINNYGFKADILRLEIVNSYGGIYSDIDSKWVIPLNKIFEYEFINYREDFRLNNISNSLFGFQKNSNILSNILINIEDHLKNVKNKLGIRKQYIPIYSGPCFFTHFYKTCLENNYNLNLIPQYVCILGHLGEHPNACYRHYGLFPELHFTYQTFDSNW